MKFGRTTQQAKGFGGSAGLRDLETSDAGEDSASSGTSIRPVALFVVGVQRTGSSALTRILSLCGATLPTGLMGADAGNHLGRWEPRAALRLNDIILRRRGSTWYDPSLRLHEEGAFDANDKAACTHEIESYCKKLPAAPLVVIKDLHITVLLDMWFEAARRAGFDVAAVITVRHPEEVIGSLQAYTRTPPELGSALWLKYNLLVERNTRGYPRVFVEYTNLLSNWRQEIKRISTALGIELDTRNVDAIESFLTPGLRHQRQPGPVNELFGTDWLSAVYKSLHAAARDEPVDEPSLDRVFGEYRACERTFRLASDEFHRRNSNILVRLLRPWVWPLLEIRAKVHRRRPDWA